MSTTWRIPLAELDYDEKEELAVLNVLRSRWLTLGPRVSEFEHRVAEYLGVRHAVAVANCTCALELAFRAVNQLSTENSESAPYVLVPSMTFVATANAVLAAEMIPVLADSRGPEMPWISLEQVEAFLQNHRARAVCIMHYAGFDAGCDKAREIVDRYGAWLIEDAAHAIGGKTDAGKPLGTRGDIACFSFFSNKNLATGEGGLLATNRDDVAQLARLMRSHGLTSGTTERHFSRTTGYDVVSFGHNFRCTEIVAALGLSQLEKLDRGNEHRREVYRRYMSKLAGISGVSILPPPPDASLERSAAHICVALFSSSKQRDSVKKALHDAGVQTSHHYTPIHKFTFYKEQISRGRVIALPAVNAETFSARALTLPLFPGLSPEAVDEICSIVAQAVRRD